MSVLAATKCYSGKCVLNFIVRVEHLKLGRTMTPMSISSDICHDFCCCCQIGYLNQILLPTPGSHVEVWLILASAQGPTWAPTKPNLGRSVICFQGIWLCEHRDYATPRTIVITLNGIWMVNARSCKYNVVILVCTEVGTSLQLWYELPLRTLFVIFFPWLCTRGNKEWVFWAPMQAPP